jgi:hypothetical protein
MNRAAAICLAAACFLSAGSAARASEISWSYQFVSDGHSVNFIHSNHAFGLIGLPGNGSGSRHTTDGATTDISTKIWSFSTASASHPQSVANLPFAVNLRITDRASGVSAYVSFSGALSGNIWNNGSTLHPTFSGPPTRQVDINHHLFTVSYESFAPPKGPGHAGKFTFDVKTQHNPEPPTLVLAAIGVPFFGVTLRRRYRRRNG